MNDEFSKRAIQPVDTMTVWPYYDLNDTSDDTSNKPLPKLDAEMVLGYVPVNRHDRRKAKKLLRSKR